MLDTRDLGLRPVHVEVSWSMFALNFKASTMYACAANVSHTMSILL